MIQKVVTALNNKYLLAVIAFLFLLGVIRAMKR